MDILITSPACYFYPQSRVEKECLYGNRIRIFLVVRAGNTAPECHRPSRGLVPIDHNHGPSLCCGVQPWAAILFTGGTLPLAVLIALIVCSLIALNIGALARYLPSAGGLFTYVSHGLGVQAGWMTGWLFSLCAGSLRHPFSKSLLLLVLATLFVDLETGRAVDG